MLTVIVFEVSFAANVSDPLVVPERSFVEAVFPPEVETAQLTVTGRSVAGESVTAKLSALPSVALSSAIVRVGCSTVGVSTLSRSSTSPRSSWKSAFTLSVWPISAAVGVYVVALLTSVSTLLLPSTRYHW